MKDFDNSLISQIESEEAVTFWLIDLTVDDAETYYYSSLDIEIVYDGNTYTPYEFTIKPMNYSGDMSVDKVNLEFANVDLALTTPLLFETDVYFDEGAATNVSILLLGWEE